MRWEAEMLAVMGTLEIRLPFVGKAAWAAEIQNADIRFIGNWECNRCTDVLQFSCCSQTPAVRVSLGRTFSNQFIIFVSRCVTADSIIQLLLTDTKTSRYPCFLPTPSMEPRLAACWNMHVFVKIVQQVKQSYRLIVIAAVGESVMKPRVCRG